MKINFVCVFVALAGCSGNPQQPQPQDVISIACARTDQYLIERCAEAIGDVYSVFHARALELVKDPSTPEDVKRQLKQLDEDLTPAVRRMVETALNYVSLRGQAEAEPRRAELAVQILSVRPRVQTLPEL